MVAPICEEFLFRGYIFTALRNWRGPWPAALITGLLFGGVHAGSAPVLDLVPLAALGFGLCLLYRCTGLAVPVHRGPLAEQLRRLRPASRTGLAWQTGARWSRARWSAIALVWLACTRVGCDPAERALSLGLARIGSRDEQATPFPAVASHRRWLCAPRARGRLSLAAPVAATSCRRPPPRAPPPAPPATPAGA